MGSERMTEERLEEIEARAASAASRGWGWSRCLRIDVPILVARVRELQAALAREESAHAETLAAALSDAPPMADGVAYVPASQLEEARRESRFFAEYAVSLRGVEHCSRCRCVRVYVEARRCTRCEQALCPSCLAEPTCDRNEERRHA